MSRANSCSHQAMRCSRLACTCDVATLHPPYQAARGDQMADGSSLLQQDEEAAKEAEAAAAEATRQLKAQRQVTDATRQQQAALQAQRCASVALWFALTINH